MKKISARISPITKRIQAMLVAAPAMPLSPSAPAIKPTIRNVNAQPNMGAPREDLAIHHRRGAAGRRQHKLMSSVHRWRMLGCSPVLNGRHAEQGVLAGWPWILQPSGTDSVLTRKEENSDNEEYEPERHCFEQSKPQNHQCAVRAVVRARRRCRPVRLRTAGPGRGSRRRDR